MKSAGGEEKLGDLCFVSFSYVNFIMFNKVLFWIFVRFLKTWIKRLKKESVAASSIQL